MRGGAIYLSYCRESGIHGSGPRRPCFSWRGYGQTYSAAVTFRIRNNQIGGKRIEAAFHTLYGSITKDFKSLHKYILSDIPRTSSPYGYYPARRPGLTEYAACKSEQAHPALACQGRRRAAESIAGQPYNLIITELMFRVK